MSWQAVINMYTYEIAFLHHSYISNHFLKSMQLSSALPESFSNSLTFERKAGSTNGKGGQLMPVVLSLLSTSIITMSFFCPVNGNREKNSQSFILK